MDSVLERLNSLTLENCEDFCPNFSYGKVIKVYDGDTITVGTYLSNSNIAYQFQVRLMGVDTPELRTRDKIEKQAGLFVRDRLRELLMEQIVKIDIEGMDKYGRILGNIYVSNIGDDNTTYLHVNQWLLDNNYAYPYQGKTKLDKDWSHLVE